MRILRFWDLESKGIPYTRKHLLDLVKQGRFPKPIKLSAARGPSTHIGWIESEIDDYVAARLAERDTAA